MPRRAWVNLALLLLVGGLAGLARWSQQPAPQPPPEPLLGLSADSVAELRVERPGHPPMRLRPENGDWRLAEPLNAAADGKRVQSLLRLLTAPPAARYPLAGLEPARYGLEQPAATLWLNDQALRFGARAPLQQGRYLATGDELLLVDESYFQLLNAGPAGFASRRLLPADAVIEALRLPGLALRRAGPGWALEPAPETPSADNVRALLQAWRRAEAIWLEYRPGDAAAADIELSTSAGDIAFTLRRQDNELVLYRADLGLEYHLPGQAVETLLKLPLIPPLDDA